MRSRTLQRCFSVATVALCTFAGGSARAQTAPANIALDRFDPAPAGDRMFGVQSPFAAGDPALHVMALADYAHNPLVLRTVSDGTSQGAIVGGQLFLHLNATLALWNRINLNVEMPFALSQTGDSPTVGGFSSPTGAQAGDLRLGARVALFGGYFDPFQLAVGGYVWTPTGGDGYVSDKKVRGMPQLIAGGRFPSLVWSFAIGPQLRPSQNIGSVTDASSLDFGGGFGVLLLDNKHLQIGPEFKTSITLDNTSKRNTGAEALVDVRYRIIDDLEIGIGAGPGLSKGIGTPDFRGVAMIAYTPEMKEADRDHDGILDKDDACPDVPGVKSDDPKKNGCPEELDRDHDGILDKDDACPDVPGVKSDDPKKNGCPEELDRDHDGILDKDDACPDVPGVKSDDPKKNGCPEEPDRDHDGIPDKVDACPDKPGPQNADPAINGCPDTDGDGIYDNTDACPEEKGKPNADPKKNGCPEAVVVKNDEIFILEQVQFDTDRATIKPVSDKLLDEVAGVLKDHPELLKIEVQGHTDNRGGKAHNQKLSQDRSESVKAALVKRGIDGGRLVPKGYGQDVPIDDNKTDAGRAKNRRVQFKIVEKTQKQAR